MTVISLEPLSPTTKANVEESSNTNVLENVPSGRREVLPHDSPPNPSDADACLLLRTNIQFATMCWAAMLNGWSDGSSGPLLPRIQTVYHVGYAVVSLIFIFVTLGYFVGCMVSMVLSERIGFGKIHVIGTLCQVAAFSIQAAAAPFPAFVFAYTINSFGMALQAVQNLGYNLRLKDNPRLRTGILMAVYGAGGTLSPLSATYFSQIPHWSYHFLISLGIAVPNSIFYMTVFRFKDQEGCLAEIGITNNERGTSNKSSLRQIFALKDVHLLAAFILVYVGAEVTISGWIVTYVIKLRNGPSSSGYLSSGFWAGVALGRVLLIKLNILMGESRALLVYSLLSISLQLVVWFVPSLVADAIAIGFIGLLLGPMYPILANHVRHVVPQWLFTSTIGWIAGCGQAGSTLMPFLAGVIAQKAGITALQPVLVALFVVMISLWVMVSKPNLKPSPELQAQPDR